MTNKIFMISMEAPAKVQGSLVVQASSIEEALQKASQMKDKIIWVKSEVDDKAPVIIRSVEV